MSSRKFGNEKGGGSGDGTAYATRLPAAQDSTFLGKSPAILPEDREDAESSSLQTYRTGGVDRTARVSVEPRSTQGWPSLAEMPALPRRGRGTRSPFLSFFICVVVPVAASIVYYAHFASNQYVSEFRFTVQDNSPNQPVNQSQGASALLGLLGASSGQTVNQNYIVVDYLTSRTAVEELEKRIHVVSLYSRDSIDELARFNSSRPFEKFVTYWQRMNTAQYDPITGIANVQVRAFAPEDAQLIAKTMVTLSEELINRINSRMHTDAVKFAANEVKRGEDRLKDIRNRLTKFRNLTGVIDPNASLVASNSQLAQTLRATIAQLETQIRSYTDQKLNHDSPVMTGLRAQANAAQQQLAALEGGVARSGHGTPLSDAVAEFEQLDLERQLAQTMLTSAQQSLDQARAVAAAKFVYIEPYVQPDLATSATYPRPSIIIPMIALFSFVFWNLLRIAARSVREHYALP